MLITIVIPVYNMENTIKKTLYSILNQSYEELEIIIIDDGSTDNSLKIINELAKIDNRLVVIKSSNQGAGKARNLGINIARGNYIYFCDADDEMDEKLIEKCVESINENDSSIIVFGYERINIKEKTSSVKKYEKLILSGDEIRNNYERHFEYKDTLTIQGAPWNKLFKMDLIRKFNLKFPDLRRHQDEIFIMEYMNYAENVTFLDEKLYKHFDNDIEEIIKKFPVNYYEIVHEVYELRNIRILEWNIDNIKIQSKIKESYIISLVKALEILVSKSNYKKFLEIGNFIKVEYINELKCDVNSKYQAKIIKLIQNSKFKKAYVLLYIKLFIQKNFSNYVRYMKKINRK